MRDRMSVRSQPFGRCMTMSEYGLDARSHPNRLLRSQWGFLFNCGYCHEVLDHDGFSREGAEAYFAAHIQIHTGLANIEWSADGFCQAIRLPTTG